MISIRKLFCIASFLFLLTANIASAATERSKGEEKNLRGRMGVGFASQISTTTGSVPAVSMKYYMSRSSAVSLAVGVSSAAPSTIALGGKYYKNIFLESNLIFYGGFGLGLISQAGKKYQGSLFMGAEYFFSQLPSLGFTFEFGIKGDNTTGSFAIRTTGDSFLTGGIHFYF